MSIQRARLERLGSEIAVLTRQCEKLQRSDTDLLVTHALEEAHGHLQNALGAKEKRRVDEGWTAVHRAQEALVHLYDRESLERTADNLLRQVERLDRGKDRMLREWLDTATRTTVDDEVLRTRVQRALRVRNDHWETFYMGGRLDDIRMRILAGFLAFGIAVFIFAASRGFVPVPDAAGATPGSFYAVVAVLGYVGGTAVAILGIATGRSDEVLPARSREGQWHLLRGLFGSASAIIVVLAMQDGLLSLAVGGEQPYYAVSGIAGLSEGLLLSLGARVGGGKN